MQYFAEHPEDRIRIGRDDDVVVRAIKAACDEGGIGYDDELELHHPAAILMLRRSSKSYM